MTSGLSLLLIAAGAILRYAVTATTSSVDLRVVGLVLMIVGIVGLILSLIETFLWAPYRRRQTPDDRQGGEPRPRDPVYRQPADYQSMPREDRS